MRIAVLLDNPFIDDRRVSREINTLLSASYTVSLFCVKSNALPELEKKGNLTVHRIFGQEIYDIKKQASLKTYLSVILGVKPEVVHCHDQLMLHLGGLLKRKDPGIKLIYDSHELFHGWPLNLSKFNSPTLFLKSWIVRKWQILREKQNGKYIDRLVTVNQSLANILTAYFKLNHPAVVLRNIPEYADFHVNKRLLRGVFNLGDEIKILVFIGSAVYPKTLNLEQVIQETAGMDRLAFIIIAGEQGGKRELMEWTYEKGFRHVFFHPKIRPEEIGPVLASCDVGVVPTWNKKDLSYWLALDNKLFEYILSEIPVLCTLQPEVAAIVKQFDVGEAVNPDQSGAYKDGLEKILETPEYYQSNLKRAKKHLNWEAESAQLLQLYKEIALS